MQIHLYSTMWHTLLFSLCSHIVAILHISYVLKLESYSNVLLANNCNRSTLYDSVPEQICVILIT